MQEPRGRTIEEREYYSLSERVYKYFAPFYDVLVSPFRRTRREVAALAEVGRDSAVLDVATGTGEQAVAFAATGADVIGVDLSEQMLRIARRKNGFSKLRFQRADAVELPFAEASFDLVCISFALHEMPESVREAVLHDMARVTKPGGRIVVVDYGLPRGRLARSLVYHLVKLYERDNYADFVRRDVTALLGAAGFRADQAHPKLLGVAKVWIGTKPQDVGVTRDDASAPSAPCGPVGSVVAAERGYELLNQPKSGSQ